LEGANRGDEEEVVWEVVMVVAIFPFSLLEMVVKRRDLTLNLSTHHTKSPNDANYYYGIMHLIGSPIPRYEHSSSSSSSSSSGLVLSSWKHHCSPSPSNTKDSPSREEEGMQISEKNPRDTSYIDNKNCGAFQSFNVSHHEFLLNSFLRFSL